MLWWDLFASRLFALSVGCSPWDVELAMHVLGEFAEGLVVFGTAECITLL